MNPLNSSYLSRTPSLLDLMPTKGNGVFDYLTDFDFIEPESNNIEYLYNRSGEKLPSPLVTRLADGDTLSPQSLSSLANIIRARFRYKWDRIWQDLIDAGSPFQNVDLTEITTYGKTSNKSGKSATTKTGTETRTRTGTEKTTDEYDASNPYKSTRTIEGGWKDTGNDKSTRKGEEKVTESADPTSPYKQTKTTTGGWADTDTTANKRTGSQIVTEKGDTEAAVFGFNSATAVPASRTGPADASGLTTQTDYGESGLVDQKSGAVTRKYADTGLVESTTESGSRLTSTTYGDEGLTNETDRNLSRQYSDYKDIATQTGKRTSDKEYSNVKDQTEFNDRSDETSSSSTDTLSGSDTRTTAGFNFRNLKDRVDILEMLYKDPLIYNFFEVIYSDIDEVLTCPIFI